MNQLAFAWTIFGIYVVATVYLSVRGMRKTTDLAGFALGNKDMGPVLVGITLAAATASSSTFIINPGFVYGHGVSALLHFGVASIGGVILGLIVLSKGFRKHGNQSRALTLPHWIGARYDSGAMRTYFAVLNLLLAVAFVVLIIKGSALVMEHTLGVNYTVSVILIVAFVFSYIMIGGTYAHAYTNALQGIMMIAVALAIVGSGLHLFGDGVDGFLGQVAARDPNLVQPINEASPLFGSVWEVFISGFIVSIGLVCQPHILTKSLYLKNDRDVNRYLGVSAVIFLIFASILVAGLYARITLPGMVEQDGVMPAYITSVFSPIVGVLISVALLAAGMSTMDGILVSASTIAGNDLFLGALGQRLMPDKTDAERERIALKASRWILAGMGVTAFVIALDPPQFVGLFAQMTVYGLVAAGLAPIAFGIFVRDVESRDAFAAAIAGPAVHFTHYITVRYVQGEFINPAGPAAEGTIVSFAVLTGLTAWRRARRRATELTVITQPSARRW